MQIKSNLREDHTFVDLHLLSRNINRVIFSDTVPRLSYKRLNFIADNARFFKEHPEEGAGLSQFCFKIQLRSRVRLPELFQIMRALTQHFGRCGEITSVYNPTDQDGATKGIARIGFKDNDAFNKALKLDGSELGDRALSVKEARPRPDVGGSGHSRDRGGGWDFGGGNSWRSGGLGIGGGISSWRDLLVEDVVGEVVGGTHMVEEVADIKNLNGVGDGSPSVCS